MLLRSGAQQVRGKEDIDLPFDPPPDLAIEVDISKSSINKLSICAAMGISEVWRYHGSAVEVHVLGDDLRYARSQTSTVLPKFPLDELNRLLRERGSQSDMQIVRSFRQLLRGQGA